MTEGEPIMEKETRIASAWIVQENHEITPAYMTGKELARIEKAGGIEEAGDINLIFNPKILPRDPEAMIDDVWVQIA